MARLSMKCLLLFHIENLQIPGHFISLKMQRKTFKMTVKLKEAKQIKRTQTEWGKVTKIEAVTAPKHSATNIVFILYRYLQ